MIPLCCIKHRPDAAEKPGCLDLSCSNGWLMGIDDMGAFCRTDIKAIIPSLPAGYFQDSYVAFIMNICPHYQDELVAFRSFSHLFS